MTTAAAGDGPGLVSDCSSCFALCCVALPFARSVDFPTDKGAGDPCRNLLADSRCSIHDRLRGSGYRGCTVFECFGAGQQVSQVTFGGRDWRDHPDNARQMYAVFPVMRQLHEMLVHLTEADALTALTDRELTDSALTDTGTHRAPGVEVASLAAEVTELVKAEADRLEHLDVVGLRARVGALLDRASQRVRSSGEQGRDLGHRRIGRGADLVGADLRGLDLRGGDLRGAHLIAADLRGADLRRVDLLGADLRDADLRGTGLSQALFLTQPQLNAAKGDARTSIVDSLSRPGWWARATDGPVLTMDRD